MVKMREKDLKSLFLKQRKKGNERKKTVWYIFGLNSHHLIALLWQVYYLLSFNKKYLQIIFTDSNQGKIYIFLNEFLQCPLEAFLLRWCILLVEILHNPKVSISRKLYSVLKSSPDKGARRPSQSRLDYGQMIVEPLISCE